MSKIIILTETTLSIPLRSISIAQSAKSELRFVISTKFDFLPRSIIASATLPVTSIKVVNINHLLTKY